MKKLPEDLSRTRQSHVIFLTNPKGVFILQAQIDAYFYTLILKQKVHFPLNQDKRLHEYTNTRLTQLTILPYLSCVAPAYPG